MSMKIKGEYRDVVKKNDEIIEDRGWKLNHISQDLGKLIAAMMRNKDFTSSGITFMAVGSSSTAGTGNDNGESSFNKRVKDEVFPSLDFDKPVFSYINKSDWAWAKKIENINFLDDKNNQLTAITNKLQINIIFEKKDLSEKALEFKEFALLGTGTYKSEPREIFFINYVAHDPISLTFQGSNEDENTDLTRTVQLTFP